MKVQSVFLGCKMGPKSTYKVFITPLLGDIFHVRETATYRGPITPCMPILGGPSWGGIFVFLVRFRFDMICWSISECVDPCFRLEPLLSRLSFHAD